MKTIDQVWAIVSVDPEDNTEGICASFIGGMWVPLLAADEARLPFIMEQGIKLAGSEQYHNKTIKLIKLTTREEIETL